MKNIIKLLFILILSSNFVLSNQNIKFNDANDAFNDGKYQLSAELYQELINDGFKESEIYYNLGNAFFRLNNIPAAIINYERAIRLSPNDDDIDFNLRIANLKIVDKFDKVPKFFIFTWYDQIVSLFYSGEWGYIAVASFWLLLIMLFLLFYGYAPKLRKLVVLIFVTSVFTLALSVLMGYKAYRIETSISEAIIFSPSVYIKSAPDPGSTDLFILHEGTKVHIMESIDNWLQIKLENGNVGWLKKEELEII